MANSNVKLGLPKVSNYVKNVGKSLGFAAVDTIKSHASGLTEFLDSNEDILKKTYASVKDMKSTMKNVERSTKQTKVFEALDFGLKNIKEDIRTGNFYNKAREEAIGEKALGLDDDGEFDFDFNFDDSSDGTSSSSSTSNSFDEAIGAAANAQTLATKEGTALVVQSNILSTKIMMGEFNKVNAGIGSVYNGISELNNFMKGPMQAHLENSKLFFEQSTKLMQEQAAMMKEILEMQRNLYAKKSEEYKESRLSQSMDYNGNINIEGYIKNIKKNIKDLVDSSGLGMMNMDIGGGNPFLLMVANPFQYILNPLMNVAMSKGLKTSLKNLDKSLTSLFSQTVSKLNRKGKDLGNNAFVDIITKIFGINLDRKESINTANYEKGPVPFDGITRKTIIEVIPGYLARIEAALTGNEERHYDSQSGKWKNIKTMKKDFDNIKSINIGRANSDVRNDLRDLFRNLNDKDKKIAEANLNNMLNKIYEDGGDFRPAFEKGSKYGKRTSGKIKTSDGVYKDAYKYYGASSKKDFDMMLSFMKDNTIKNIAASNMQAIESYSKMMKEFEKSGAYNVLFNGAYPEFNKDNKNKKSGNKLYGTGILASSMDNSGNNVFYYLREILQEIKGRHKPGKKNKGRNKNITTNNIVNNNNGNNREGETSEDGESDGEPPSGDIDWTEVDKQKEKEREEEEKKKRLGGKVKEKFSKTKVGKFLYDSGSTIGRILAAPMDYATKLLDKADQSIFKMMFGTNEYKDDEGNQIDSVFEYMIYRVKKSFKDMTDWVKKQIFDPLKEKYLKPFWNKYGKPVTDEIKGYANRGWNRIKQGADNTLGRGFRSIKDKLRLGGVVGVDDVAEAVQSAEGRYVTKRGLTMISPGEMIIPASFDKKEQKKMLKAEKNDKDTMMKMLLGADFNAKGTVSTDEYKKVLQEMMKETKGDKKRLSKIGAGGVLGLGGALITGINPVIGAIAGAGLSFITESETARNFLFGKELEDGTRNGGIIPKKAIDFISKYGSDMADFGIAGGILGLVTPFGILGGSALGAGVGFLKNNENFKKFIFGNEETGEKGLISKETANKVKGFIKKHVPAAVVGAGVGMLTGPFGLLGNAVLGSGLGLLTTTNKFREFLFGKEVEVTTADGETKKMKTGGFLTAIKNGIMKPVQKEMEWFADNFKKFAQKHVLNPLKRFWEPFSNAIKNSILNVGERIKDHLNDMFEKRIGIPLSDFLQEKIFKPVSHGIMKFLRLPFSLAKLAIGAPAHLLGFSGDNLKSHQINAGTADYMTAAERLQWRNDHDIRNGLGFDTHKQEDEALANMSEEQLEKLVDLSRAGMSTRSQLSKQLGVARGDVGEAVSAYMNTNGLYSRKTGMGYGKVKKAVNLGVNGNFDALERLITKSNLSEGQKDDLLKIIKDKSGNAIELSRALKMYDTDKDKRDAMVKDLIGHKFNSRNEYRKFNKYAETELADRKKNKSIQQNETPEVHATYTFANIYKDKTDKMIEFWEKTNNYLKAIVDPKFAKELLKEEKKDENTVESVNSEEIGKDNKNKKKSKIRSKKTGASVGVATVANTLNPTIVNPDSKEAKEQEEEKENKKKLEQEGNDADREQVSLLQKLHDKMFGKEKKDKERKGIFGKLLGGTGGLIGGIASGIGSLLNFLGAGGKYIKLGALALAGIPLFGYASDWFKTSVWPKMKETFIGTDEKPGLLYGLTKWFGEKFNKIKNWVFGTGEYKDNGMSDFIRNGFAKAIPNLVGGIGYALEHILPPLISSIIKNLPGIIFSLGKGILGGIRDAIFGNKAMPMPENINTANLNISSNSTNIDNFRNLATSTNSSLDNFSYIPIETRDVDYSWGSSNPASKNPYYNNATSTQKAMMETDEKDWLGNTHRTGYIQIDENGNMMNPDIQQYNQKKSFAGHIVDVSKNLAYQTFTGQRTGTAIGNILSGLKIKMPKSVLGAGVQSTKGVLKGAGNIMNESVDIANRLRTGFGLTDRIAEKNAIKESNKAIFNEAKDKLKQRIGFGIKDVAEDVVKEGAEETVEKAVKRTIKDKLGDGIKNISTKIDEGKNTLVNKLISGIKKVFDFIFGDSFLGEKIKQGIKWAFGKNTINEKLIKSAFDKFADKLGDSIAGRLGKSLLKSTAQGLLSVTPIVIVDWIANFWDGYSNAESYLGVVKEDKEFQLGMGHRILMGIITLVNSRICGGIIPIDIVIDLALEYIAPLFGLDTTALTDARNRATTIMQQIAAENPDQDMPDNIWDWNNKDKWWYKAGESIKKAFGFDKKSMAETKAANNKIVIPALVSDGIQTTFSNGEYIKNTVNKNSGKRRNVGFARNAGSNSSVLNSLGSLIQYPINGLTSVASNIAEKINKLISGVKDNSKKDKDIIKKATSGAISVTSAEYWKLPNDNNNIINIFNNVFSTIERLMNSAIIGISSISSNIQSSLTKSINKAKNSVSSGLAAVANLGKSVTSKSGSSRNRFGLAHTYQNDPSIANMKYGDSTIGEAGCGPVAAANLLNDSVTDAAKYAERKGMTVPGGGTDIKYFDSYLRDNGMNTSRTTNKSQVLNALKSGAQAVMLGADGDPNGPFGTTPHFVTAKGLDSHGNIIAEDPDLPQSRMIYNSRHMLNNMDAAVIAKRGSKRNKAFQMSNEAKKRDKEFFRKMNSKDMKFNKYGRAREIDSGFSFTKSTYIPGSGQTVKGMGITSVKQSETATKSWMNRNNVLNGKNLGPQAVLNVARSQIGVTDGGSSYTKYHKAYGASACAWCVIFIWWCFNQAGASKLFCNGQKSAGCSNTYRYYSNGSSGQLVDTPQPGDMVLFNFHRDPPDHIGIVESVNDDGSITTIEGNTSSNGSQYNGGCVERKTRNKSDLWGKFMRPNWPYDYDASSVIDMSKYGDSADYKTISINGGGMTGSVNANGSTTSSSEESQEGTLISSLKNLGTGMIKKIYGEEAYNALFGSTNTSDSSGSSDLSFSANSNDIGLDKESRTKIIWDTLTKKLGFTKIGAAAAMGNFEQENDNDPNTLECDYLYKGDRILPGIPDTVTAAANNANLNRYTTDFVFPAYGNFPLNKSFYKVGNDYYPGFGLLGWTGPNAKRLLDWSKSKGKDWRSGATQMEFFAQDGATKNAAEALSKYNNVRDAAYAFARDYEGNLSDGHTNDRMNYAESYYKKFAGGRRNANMHGLARNNVYNPMASIKVNTSNLGQNTNYLNSKRYSNTLNSTINRLQSMPNTLSGDYNEFLKAIVSILMSISDNTSVLQEILQILSNNFNINLKSSDVDKAAHKRTKAQTEAALNELISRTSGNTVSLSKLINSKDTDYVLNAMIAIASE